MSLKTDLETKVKEIFKEVWTERNGIVVPEPEDLKLSNDAVKLDGVVLYADLAESTNLVDNHLANFSAEIYKTFLHCASKIIKSEGGTITAFDGDRVMGVFIGDSKNSSATKCAMKIKYAVEEIINPALKEQYPKSFYNVKYSIGIDACELFIARTGVRGSNDLVWVGRAANYAAKLCALRDGNYTTYITKDVYSNLNEKSKYSKGKDMWVRTYWSDKNIYVYKSSYRWPF